MVLTGFPPDPYRARVRTETTWAVRQFRSREPPPTSQQSPVSFLRMSWLSRPLPFHMLTVMFLGLEQGGPALDHSSTVVVLVTKSCLTLCNPMDCSLPGSSVRGISQARILEWVAISFFRGSSQPRDWTLISCISRWILFCWATREAPMVTLLQWITQEALSLSSLGLASTNTPLSQHLFNLNTNTWQNNVAYGACMKESVAF